MGSKGGSSPASNQPAGTTTSTQSSVPWDAQQPYLQNQFGSAQSLYSNYSPQYYPTSTVSPFTDAQNQGLQQLTQFGQAGGTPAVNNANNMIGNIENGSFLSAGNPYFQNMVGQIGQAIAPSINGQFAQAGRYGSGANQQAYDSALSNTAGQLANQNYTQGMNNILQGAYVAPQLEQAQLQPANALLTAGGAQQSQNQAQLSDQVNRFNFDQSLPYNKLNQFASNIGGSYGGTSTLTQPYFQNQLANSLAGAAGGSALGKGLGSSLFGSGSTGSSLGGLGGGLGGLKLSDRRAKREIAPIFISHSGLTVYAYRYLESDDDELGFMADEVERLHPAAIVELCGLKHVDYHRAVQ